MEFIPFYLIFTIVSVSIAPAISAAIVNSKAKDRNIVTAHPLGWVLSIVFVVDFSLLIAYFAVTSKPAGYIYAIVLVFILPCLWMLVDTISFRIEYDEHSFTVRNKLFRKKTFIYRDIILIRDTVSDDKLQIHGATIIIGKEEIKLSNDMVGAEDFIKLAKSRCNT